MNTEEMGEKPLYRGRVYKLRVTKPEHKKALQRNFAAARFAYNWAIDKYLEAFKELNPDYNEGGTFHIPNKTQIISDISKRFTVLKRCDGYEWLREADSNVSQGVISSPTAGFRKAVYLFDSKVYKKGTEVRAELFKPINDLRSKGKEASFPKDAKFFPQYKKSSDSIQSYQTDGRQVKKQGNTIYLPKIGYIPVWNWEDLPTKWKQTVTVTTDGIDYYVTLLSEKDPENRELSGTLGIDLGLKTLATLSDGTKIENPSRFPEAIRLEHLVKKYSRRLSILREHAPVVTNEYGKTYKKYSRKMRAISKLKRKREIELNNFKETYMKQSASKIQQAGYQYIVMENLNVKGIQRSKLQSKGVQKTGMSKFKTIIKGVAEIGGTTVIEADRFFPSSQICSNCGFIHKAMKNLSLRTFECPSCGVVLDRDVNAAINLKQIVDKHKISCYNENTENVNS